MPIVRSDILAHLERGMRVGFLAGLKDYAPKRGAFTRTVPSDGAFEIYGDLGSQPWPVRMAGQAGGGTDGRTGGPSAGGLHEGGPIVVLGGEERNLVVYNSDWGTAVGIWHNAINDDRVGGLEDWARNQGKRFEQHKDYLCFDALNSGEATTNYGACYDGLSFFNDSHFDKGAEYQTVQDNKYALSLSLDNFETVRIAGGKFKDGRGQPYGGLGHSLLVHALDLERTAAQITDNPLAYDTANQERNPYAGMIQRLAVPGSWFDSTAWVLVDPDVKPILLQERSGPELIFWDDFTQGSGVRYYKWVARYSVAYGDWRGAIMGNS
jgi:phage major head subunit gpT-like protein